MKKQNGEEKLKERNIKILRFPNELIINDIKSVINTIYQEIVTVLNTTDT